ncbi:MAG TPA: hypothetical protein VL523_14305 [Terriglobia bacterium]|nr:hypothetical protein [Terriglobia bacterium]
MRFESAESELGQREAGLMHRVSGMVKIYVIDNAGDDSEPAPVSPDFLAALTANESGGDPEAKRFEPGVYRHLKDLAEGRSAAFGRISKPLLDNGIAGYQGTAQAPASAAVPAPPAKAADYHAAHLTAAFAAERAPAIAALRDNVLRALATSWGLTQIMGYHMLGRRERVEMLRQPAFHYARAVELVKEFAARFHLDPQRDFEALFRCWNTGRPDGRTFDPGYVEKGLRRAALARQIREAAVAAPGGELQAAPAARA